MHLTVDAKRLADTAAWVAKFAPARPAAPVMAAMLLTASDDGTLALSAFDYETSATAHLDAHVETPGPAAVPARLLAAVAARLGDGQATLRLDGARLHITCGATSYTLTTLPAEDYPTLPEAPPVLGEVDAAIFAESAAQAATSAGTDTALPVLTGLRLRFGSGLTIDATDRYRISQHILDWKPQGQDPDLTVVAPHGAITSAANGMAGTILLGADARLLSMSDDTRTVTTTLLDGGYPNIDAFLEGAAGREATASADVEVADLVAAIDRAAVVASAHEPVLLAVSEGQITVTCGAEDTGGTSTGAHTDGTAEVACNPKMLVPLLRSLGVATVHLHITGDQASKPTLITPAGEDATGRRGLIAPIRGVSGQTA